jgi:2-polyprenyl-6-methoxyphenol hydroxylase-like FAD-dependent oxidoreductase
MPGIGGIAAAVSLGRRGHHVVVLEAAPKVNPYNQKTGKGNIHLITTVVGRSRRWCSNITQYGQIARP